MNISRALAADCMKCIFLREGRAHLREPDHPYPRLAGDTAELFRLSVDEQVPGGIEAGLKADHFDQAVTWARQLAEDIRRLLPQSMTLLRA